MKCLYATCALFVAVTLVLPVAAVPEENDGGLVSGEALLLENMTISKEREQSLSVPEPKIGLSLLFGCGLLLLRRRLF